MTFLHWSAGHPLLTGHSLGWSMINSNLLMSKLHPLLLLLLLPTQTCFCRVPKSVTVYPVTPVKTAGSPSIPLHPIPSSNLLPKCFSYLCGLHIHCYHCQVPAGPYQLRPGLPTKASCLPDSGLDTAPTLKTSILHNAA